MSETVERIYPEALNLRSVAKMERKKGNVELAHVIEGAADLYERTASDVDSATKALNAHSAVVIDQHEEIASLRAQLDEARRKAIDECIAELVRQSGFRHGALKATALGLADDIRALLSESKT